MDLNNQKNSKMEEKALEALNELKDESQNIINSSSLTNWRNKATNLIIRIYGESSIPEE